MTKKIFRSTFFTSIFVLISCFILILGILYGFFEKQLENELASEANYIAYAIEDKGNAFFDSFSSSNKRITLIAPSGDVIADTMANPQNMDNHSDRAEFRKALETGSGTSVRYSNTLTEKTVYYATKLSDGNILRISTTQYTIMTIILGLMQPIILVLMLALILSLFLASKVSKSVLKPINSIDLDHPEECDTYDELSPLLHKIVTQRKTIDSQIAAAHHMQDEFKLITENMSEGFLVIDKDANLLSCNSAALGLLDAQKNEGTVLSLNRSEKFRKAIATSLSGKRFESVMQHEDSTYNLIMNPVCEDGKVVGAVMVIIDITENAEREAIRREFTANVSHELKTPLTSISGFAELLMQGGTPDSIVTDFSRTIYTEAQRLITLVNDIIKISELDEKDEHFVKEKVDLFELSKEIMERLKINAGKKNISFNLIGEKAEITGVRQILDDMIYNLCDNAIKYNKENGSVDIIIEQSGPQIKLSVRDTGIGIPSTQQIRVFERFYRVDKSRSKAEGGTGLGLSIVKHGAIYHNAKISLDSIPEQGTTVTLTFNK